MSVNKNEIFKITGAPVEEEVKQSEETDVEKTSAEETGSTENEASESKPVSHKRRLEKGSTAYEILDWFRTICIGVLAGIFIVTRHGVPPRAPRLRSRHERIRGP